MRKLLLLLKDKLTSSYWFYPSALFLFAIFSAVLTIELDYTFGEKTHQFLKDVLFFNKLSLATARVYLSTLVGAIITVAGVVFSLTILTVSSASNQFGPRILNNFMRDKANQLTLGVYTSTFVYCSTILLSLYENPQEAFIPYLSILVSYGLALTCVGFLIFYIHHIPASLRIENIIHRVAKQTLAMAEKPFPEGEGVKIAKVAKDSIRFREFEELEETLKYECGKGSVGYVQAIDLALLVEASEMCDAFFKLNLRPGDFNNGETALVLSDTKLDEQAQSMIRDAFAIGMDRTLPQNLMFLFSQMMEIAIRAMSPGINDPITAMSCVDWIEACLLKLAEKENGNVFILDKDKNPRIFMRPPGYEETLFHMRKGLAEHMSKNFATSMHLMEALSRLYQAAGSEEQRSAVRACAAELMAFAKRGVPVGGQRDRLTELFSSFSPNNLNYSHERHEH